MALFGIDDVETQQEAFKLYNDWVHEFCKADTKRLYASPLVSGRIDQSQNMTVAAMQIADMNVCAHRS